MISGTYLNNAKVQAVPMDYLWGSYYKEREHNPFGTVYFFSPFSDNENAMNMEHQRVIK